MTFSCRNYDLNLDQCRKLHDDCIPGRRGCALEGKVKLSEELEKRLAALEEKKQRQRAGKSKKLRRS
ncbi:hypothetical protein [Desulfurivibrio dismutans]|uniref:hypothetical protein n=1 Tax=Desulfurivibrio dismutans TaxID=1398908 RepID=UPI0023DAEB89|nr:hypothetical protein [Desulfurivibrio alkaliphilus]MDF1614918.1 hypothetical protein [Desulfurivibrio alkaliphilus]